MGGALAARTVAIAVVIAGLAGTGPGAVREVDQGRPADEAYPGQRRPGRTGAGSVLRSGGPHFRRGGTCQVGSRRPGGSSQASRPKRLLRRAPPVSAWSPPPAECTIWRVAVQEIESEPLLGVGADNFVFEYDRLRTKENYKPKQAHSFELQVLGETGAVGGLFAFGGILLAAGGLLWSRFSAAKSDSRPARDSPACGWDMALLAGCTYWLVHASVDWLWQMAGVTVTRHPAARRRLWPRRTVAPKRPVLSRPVPRPPPRDLGHASSVCFCWPLSLAVIVFAGLPYLSLQIQDSARGLADTDVPRAARRAACRSRIAAK